MHRPRCFGVNKSKGNNQLDETNGYLHRWLFTLNGLQDGTNYAVCPVYNSPEFMTLDNLLNCDILHSLRMHIVFRSYIANGE